MHGVLRLASLVAGEGLRQPPVEEAGGVEHTGRDHRRLLLEAVPPQPPGDERVVERPDRADVVSDGVVAALSFGHRPDPPPREEPGPHEVADDSLGLGLVDDPAPQEMPVVGGERIDLTPVRVESQGEVPVVLDPEVAVESTFQVRRLLLQPVGEFLVLPDQARQPSPSPLRVVGVALELGRGPGETREAAVPVGDRVPRVLPALVLQTGLLVPAPIGDVAVPHEVRVLVDPVQGGPGLPFEVTHQLRVPGPARHDVDVQVIGHTCARALAEIQTDVKSLRPYRGTQKRLRVDDQVP